MKNLKSFIKVVFGVFAITILAAGCGNDISTSEKQVVEYGDLCIVPDVSNGDRAVTKQSLIKSAVVTVSGYDVNGDKYNCSSDKVSVTNGAASGITVTNIPVGSNAVVKVQAFSDDNASTAIDGIVISSRANIAARQKNDVTVNWSSTAEGNVYAELMALSVNTSKMSSADVSLIKGKIPSVNASLVNVAQIASDYKDKTLSSHSASDYVLEPAVITVTNKSVTGYSILFSDPNSAVLQATGSDMVYKVSPGTWKIYAVSESGEIEAENQITVGSSSKGTVNVKKTAVAGDGITVHLATNNSQGYNSIWAWQGSVNYTKSKQWPGDLLTDEDGDGYYDYAIPASSSMVIFCKANGSSVASQTGNLSISAAGEYVYDGSGFTAWEGGSSDGEVVITVGEITGPVKPSVSIPARVNLTGSIKIGVTSNVDLISGTAVIGGKTKTLTAGTNAFEVSEFTSKAGTLNVTVTVKNAAGTVSESGSIEVYENSLPSGDADWNRLSIYQVMVSSFIDGDKSIGYNQAYGPDKTYNYYTNSSENKLTGGDLQGIINAADYIADLGVNAIWMTPIFDSSSGENNEYLNSTGYFCYDYFKVDPKFGTNEKFAELVETYHNKGMYVILDGVFGHWNGAGVKASPTGKTAVRKNGQYKACAYPDSLEFFKEVAQYWIKEYKIDGWRFDQCYQVGNGDKSVGDNSYTNDHNYWYEIRTAIKEAADANAAAGNEWGTLGYTVGEHWNGDAATIQRGSVAPGSNGAGYGLQSCFDFPSRYRLVQTMAREEGSNSGTDFGAAMEYTYGTYTEKGYEHPEGYYPNLFFTNHDLVRYGNLLNWKFSLDPTKDEYFTRHKLMLAVLAGYSGPITTYYGDEWGAYVQGYSGPGSLGAYNDNMARSNGKIDGFTAKESALIDYYKKLMAVRNEHPAMWKGNAVKVSSTATSYVVKKTSGSETIYIAFNNGTSATSFSASGKDLITGASYSGTVSVPALSAVFVLAK